VDALARDGGIVRLRCATPADGPALTALYRRASTDSLRLRFFSAPNATMIATEVERLCRTPSATHAALVAEAGGELVGVASYERRTATATEAEFAVFVDGAHCGRGIGTLLLEHLAARARSDGVTDLVGEVLPGNFRMLRVANDLSALVWSRFDDGVIDLGLATATDEATVAAIQERERVAERVSLHPLLAPRSLAVVGAGRRPGGIGHETLRSIVEYGFTGSVYPVNAHATEVAGLPAYARLGDIPAAVDLAVIAVPAPAVAGVLREAADAGVRAAVILSSGFGEAGAAGAARQAEVLRLARENGIRLVGPNCIGLLNTDPSVRLNATFAPGPPPAGGLAVATQSGAVGIAVLEHARRTGCGLSSLVSLGNKADVSGNDLLAYWHDDPATTAVALYLESFGNPRHFARLVRELGRHKPVLAVKSGRSTAGRRAGASHTAAAASPDVAVDALFAQAGVRRVDNLGELLDAARLLTGQPLPAGDRLAILGNAGGANVLAADAAEAAGLRVPALSAALRRRLSRLTPEGAAVDNPLDLGAAASPAALATALNHIARSGEVDSVVLVVAATRANDVPAMLAAATTAADRHTSLPVAIVLLGPEPPAVVGERRTPVFDLPERAVRAMGHAAGYAAWRREPAGQRPALGGLDPEDARATVGAALSRGEGWQPYETAGSILRAYGIPVLPAATVGDAGQAVEAADCFGYPVAMKAADPDLVHKSDIGAVRLGLADAAAVRAAYADVAGAPGVSSVLVQPMAAGTVELVAGVVHDRLFGSLVMVGLGGVHTNLLGDRAFRLVPMTDLDAGRMWRALRAAPLLTGYRGSPRVHIEALEDLLLRLGRLAEDLPEVAELDLNPVLAGPDGVVAVDVKLRLAAVGREPDPVLRCLRQRAEQPV
jgi:acyl-CoA synthetase (NDP forming)/GNAT superfamily N-acetyltransferase